MQILSAMALILVVAQSQPSEETRFSSIRRDHYVGYKPGSWVIHGIYESADGSTEKLVGREKKQIAELREGVPLISRQREQNGKWSEASRGSPLVQPQDPADMEVVERRRETLQVDDKPVDCEVVRYRFEYPAEKTRGELSVWRTSKLFVPYREYHAPGIYAGLYPNVIKAEYSANLAHGRVAGSRQVVSTNRKFNVGERELRCIVESGTLTFHPNDEEAKTAQLEVWLSEDVVGHEVQVVQSATFMGEARRQVQRVNEFHTEKLTSEAPPRSGQRRITFKGLVTIENIADFGAQRITWVEETKRGPVVIIFDNASLPIEFVSAFFDLKEFDQVRMHFRGTIKGCAAIVAAMGSSGQITVDPSARFVLSPIPDETFFGPSDPEKKYNIREECLRRLTSRIQDKDNAIARAIREGRGMAFDAKEAVSLGLVDRVTNDIPK